MHAAAAELTHFPARLAFSILGMSPKREFALGCRACGLEIVRPAEWIREHPVFMCGRCFQDTPVDLAALEHSSGGRRAGAGGEPQRLALHQPPIQRRAGRFTPTRYAGSAR